MKVVKLTGGQVRSFVQCALNLLLAVPGLPKPILELWRVLVEVDELLDLDQYTDESLNLLSQQITKVPLLHYSTSS